LCRALAGAFAGSLLSLLLPGQVHANPQGATVVHGQASFRTDGNRLTVTNSAGAAIDWRSFSIAPGEFTHFRQPNAASTVLNRVTSPTPSQLLGTLTSNGKVILVNPAGIAVGRGAVVDTAGFTASTLSISDADWSAGRLLFQDAGNAGAMQVDGSIRSRNGDIVLLAPKVGVGAPAVVQAENGTVVLAAGHAAAITGRGLEGIQFELKPSGQARNLGRLEGDAVGVFAGTLHHSGAITARTATSSSRTRTSPARSRSARSNAC
jgi:filamentous hemagglutinin family protein